MEKETYASTISSAVEFFEGYGTLAVILNVNVDDLRRWAERWRAKETPQEWETHVRDPRPGQWRDVFTPKVQAVFAARFPDLIETLGYEPIARSRRTA